MTRRTIASIAATAEDTLTAEAPRATARRLSSWEIERAIKAHLKAAKRARTTHPAAVVRTSLCGGHVVNSYRYRAHTDYVYITGGRIGDLEVGAGRADAQSRAFGRGSTLLVRRVSPDQTMGTIVHSE